MSFKKTGMIRKGLQVGGYSVAKYSDTQSPRHQLRLIRNGRAVARRTFDNGLDYSAWYASAIPANTDGHDTIVKLTEELRR